MPVSVIYHDKVSGVHPVFDTLRFFRAVVRSLARCRCGHRLAPGPRRPGADLMPAAIPLPAPTLPATLVPA